MLERRIMGETEPAGTLYNLIVTDNQNGASNAATNANITVKYTKNNKTTTLGTSFKNGNTFFIPDGATSITVTGGTISNFTPETTSSNTTYTVTYKACKVTITIEGSGGTVEIRKNSYNGSVIASNTSTFSCYVGWGIIYHIAATSTTTKFPEIGSVYDDWTADTATRSHIIHYWDYTLITSGPVNLNLKSGKLWNATFLGASDCFGEGLYYSWANIEGHAKGSGYNFNSTTYSSTSGASVVAGSGITVRGNPEYDAAAATLGNGWRLPTYDEMLELVDSNSPSQLFKVITKINNKIGILLVGRGSTRQGLFMPFNKYYNGTTLYSYNMSTFWGSTWYSSSGKISYYYCSENSQSLIASGARALTDTYKYYGRGIRAIKDPS